MTAEQQTSTLGETFPELVKRLDDGIPSHTPSLLSLCLAGNSISLLFYLFSSSVPFPERVIG